jgi:hypothetical protein
LNHGQKANRMPKNVKGRCLKINITRIPHQIVSYHVFLSLLKPSSILWEFPLRRENTSHDTDTVNDNDSATTHLNAETSPLSNSQEHQTRVV